MPRNLRATGGVYIAGGISPRIVEFISNSEFRPRFEAKGRFRQYLQPIPSFVIMQSGRYISWFAVVDRIRLRGAKCSKLKLFVGATHGQWDSVGWSHEVRAVLRQPKVKSSVHEPFSPDHSRKGRLYRPSETF